MFPPCALVLFHFVLFPLHVPLGKFPLSFSALEKGLHLREQDTGQDARFMDRYPGAIVVELLFPCHRNHPSRRAALDRGCSARIPVLKSSCAFESPGIGAALAKRGKQNDHRLQTKPSENSPVDKSLRTPYNIPQSNDGEGRGRGPSESRRVVRAGGKGSQVLWLLS